MIFRIKLLIFIFLNIFYIFRNNMESMETQNINKEECEKMYKDARSQFAMLYVKFL